MADGHVLVLDGHLRSSLAVIRTLAGRGITVTSGADTRFATAHFSTHVSDTFVYPSAELAPEVFRDAVLQYLSEHPSIDALFPVGHYTTRCLSEYKEAFQAETAVPVPDYRTFRGAWNKANTLRTAAEIGIPHPETAFPESLSEAVDSADRIGYPLVVKPRTASGSRGLSFVSEEDQLGDAYESACQFDESPLLQEVIPKHGDGIGTAFLFDDGTMKADFAYRRLREYPPGGGPSTLRESIDGTEVREYGRRLLEHLDWSGVAMVEFKRDPRDGTPKLMEINPRFWGSLALPVHAGVEFPWLLWQYSQGLPIDEQRGYETGVRCRFLYPGDLLYLLSERDRGALEDMFPLRDENLHYDILSTDDLGSVAGRTVSLARHAFSPRMWKRLIFR